MSCPRTDPRLALALALVVAAHIPGRIQAETPLDRSERKAARADRYGDALPTDAVARLGTVRWRHPGAEQVVYARDGKTIYSAGLDLRQWDAATGRELHRWDLHLKDTLVGLKGCILDIEHKKLVQFEGIAISVQDILRNKEPLVIEDNRETIVSATFSPDGKLLAVRFRGEGSARLWDAATGRELRRVGKIETTDRQDRLDMDHSLAFSPDGKLLAVANEEGILRLLDVSVGEEKRRVRDPSKRIDRLVFTPNGKTLAWESEGNLRLWDTTRGGEPRRIKAFGEKAAEGHNLPFAFSPDSRVLASGWADGTIRFWQVADGRELRHTASQSVPFSALAFSPDGREVVAVSHAALRFWDVATGQERRPLAGHESTLTSLVFSPNGKTVLTTSFDSTVRVWDVTGRQRRCFPVDSEQISPPAFSPDGSRFAFVGRNGAIHVRDTDTGRQLGRLRRPPFGLLSNPAFVGGNKTVASHELRAVLRLWDMDVDKVRRLQLPGAEDLWGGRLHYSRDGSRLAVNCNSGVHLLDTATGREFSSFETSGMMLELAFAPAPDGRSLITAEAEEVSNVLNGLGPRPQSYTFSLREVATGQERCRFKSPPNEIVNAVAVSPDGRLVAFAGVRDPAIYFWELATGKQVGWLRGRDHFVSALVFSPDGRTLASASADTTVLLWDINSLVRPESSRTRGFAGGANAPLLTAPELKKLWARLSDEKAAVAYQAMVRLAASPRQSVPFLRDHVRPIAVSDTRRVRQLVTDLDSEEFIVRNAAIGELDQLGEGAGPALRELLAGKPPLEVRRRVETLLEKWAKQPLPPEILRAVEVLEQVGNSEARQVLESMALGAQQARQTREARTSLQRLSHRPVAGP